MAKYSTKLYGCFQVKHADISFSSKVDTLIINPWLNGLRIANTAEISLSTETWISIWIRAWMCQYIPRKSVDHNYPSHMSELSVYIALVDRLQRF